VRHFIREAANRPDTVRDMMEMRMVRRLQLDTEQRRKVHQILVNRQSQLRDLRQEFAPRFFEIVSNADSQISATLTPEQRERFQQLREQNRRFPPLFRREGLPPGQ
jgi:DNA polymerase IIIc chi subunit